MQNVSVSSHLDARVDQLRRTDEFQNYIKVRRHVLSMMCASSFNRSGAPSQYWQEELTGFEYLLDASPLIVQKLLHHSYHVTGLKAYDYRSGKTQAKRRFEEKLQALVALEGADLLVPQPRALGGFGYEIDGELYNLDTLKFFEVLIGMRRAGLLPSDGGRRRCVLEVGAGWGGFAHAYKSLFPDTTYVIIDLPQVLLFSGVYLTTLFPEAQLHFYNPVRPIPRGHWNSYDFVFLPHTALECFEPARLDLLINMVSFQEMTTEQCRGYVAKVHALGCPAVYSLNRDRGPYNPEMSAVSEIIAEHYHIEEITLLDVPYTKMLSRRKRMKVSGKPELPYRHIAGHRDRPRPKPSRILEKLFGR